MKSPFTTHTPIVFNPAAISNRVFAEPSHTAEPTFSSSSGENKTNTDITASTKPEHPVVDRGPSFIKVVANFNALDFLRFVTSITGGYLSGINPGIRIPSMATGGLIGPMGGFIYAF